MDLAQSYEQEEFRSSVRRLMESFIADPSGFDSDSYAAAWAQLAEIGVAGLCVNTECGGLSGEMEDIALIAMELGRAPCSAPRLESAVMAARLLEAGTESRVSDLLERLVSGTLQPAVAFYEGADPYPTSKPGTVAVPSGDGFLITGRKAAVIGAATAHCLFVTALLPSGDLAVFAIDPNSENVEIRPYRLFDTTPVADVIFNETSIPAEALILEGERANAALAIASSDALITQCAAMVGGMEYAIHLALEHLKVRKQFGRSLSEFQSLQHRVADMFIAANEARSSLYAAIAASRGDLVTREKAAARCKIKSSSNARSVVGDALHLHGGIGVTTEYAVGPLYRRAMVDTLLMGDGDYHFARVDEMECQDTH